MNADCLILAAGKSKRFYPFENKLLFEVLGKPVIVHVINFLKKNFSSFYLVSQNNIIEQEVKKFFPELDIKTIIQETPLGTAHAVFQAENIIHNDFVVVAGDTLFDPNLMNEFLSNVNQNYERFDKFLVSKRVGNSKDYGLIIEENNMVKGIIEKPIKETEGYVNTSIYYFKQSIFDELKEVRLSSRNEYEITDVLIGSYCHKTELDWIDIGYPWKLLDCLDLLFKNYGSKNDGHVENSIVKGKLILEKGSVIENSYIQGNLYLGKDSHVGPNSYIRGNVSIGDYSNIGESTTIKESIIGKRTNAKHLTYIGDSVIGNDCNFGSSSQVANFRFDGKNIIVETNGNRVDTKRNKLGVLIGNNVKVGVDAVFLPGTTIGSNSWIYPNALVDVNVPENSIFKTKYFNEVITKKNNSDLS